MNLIGIQLDSVWEDKAASHEKARRLIEAAKPQAGSLVVLPEMFATGFSMNVAAIHDSDSRETQTFLSQTAAEHKIYLLAGVVTRDASGRGRNECVVYAPDGREIARYCKMQPFTLGGESANYAAGDDVCLFEWNGFTVAPFICYDLRFPELFRVAARRGANLIPVIASWPVTREDHWMSLLKARAIENQAYVIGVNRCGHDPKLYHSGRSRIIEFSGRLLAEAGSEECAIGAEVNLNELLDYRRTLPFLADMRALSIGGGSD
jgi:predicted amidohydrolase